MNRWVFRLSQLRALRAEVEMLAARVEEIETAARGGGRRITGMPRAGSISDPVARYGVELVQLRGQLERRMERCAAELRQLYALIDRIEDSAVRQVMTYRYVDGMSWQQVAFAMGEFDEQYPRRLHNRFIQKLQVDENDGRAAL